MSGRPDLNPYRSPDSQQEADLLPDRWETFLNLLLTVFAGSCTFCVTGIGAGLLGFRLFNFPMGTGPLLTVGLVSFAAAIYISASIFRYLNKPGQR